MNNQLIEFRDTPALREQLARFIAEECQLPECDYSTPQLLALALKRRTEAVNAAIQKLLLLLASKAHAAPVIDLEVLAACQSLQTTAATSDHKPTREIVAKWAKVPADRVTEFGSHREYFEAKGATFIEEIGMWAVIAEPANVTP